MISPQAFVDPSAKIGKNVEIYPFAYIEKDVEIGDNCVIMPFVSVLKGTKMGSSTVCFKTRCWALCRKILTSPVMSRN